MEAALSAETSDGKIAAGKTLRKGALSLKRRIERRSRAARAAEVKAIRYLVANVV